MWNLSDAKSLGSLSLEEFALAEWLIENRVNKGMPLPQTTLPNMIPPSTRGTPPLTPPVIILSVSYICLHEIRCGIYTKQKTLVMGQKSTAQNQAALIDYSYNYPRKAVPRLAGNERSSWNSNLSSFRHSR